MPSIVLIPITTNESFPGSLITNVIVSRNLDGKHRITAVGHGNNESTNLGSIGVGILKNFLVGDILAGTRFTNRENTIDIKLGDGIDTVNPNITTIGKVKRLSVAKT